MYHALWADWYLPAALPALEALFFSRIDPGSAVIDVCCGSGHVTKELIQRGYHVTGIDSSFALIALARRDLPGVDFRVQEVQQLRVEKQFDAALSTFDSLNHLLTLEGLRGALRSVRRVLKPGGLFLFDMNLEEAYCADSRRWSATVEEDSVGLVRGTYDPGTKMASTELIWFKRADNEELWERRCSIVQQRCYTQMEITVGLADAGFSRIEAVSGRQAGMSSELALGRMFFSATA